MLRYNEINNYDWSKGWTHNGKAIHHFTQMVWKNTKRVGYAVVTHKNPYKRHNNIIFALLVAKYKAPGNIYGQFVHNVGRVVV